MCLLQVVLMNQVTTKILDNNRGSKLVPALGGASKPIAADINTSRIQLEWFCLFDCRR